MEILVWDDPACGVETVILHHTYPKDAPGRPREWIATVDETGVQLSM